MSMEKEVKVHQLFSIIVAKSTKQKYFLRSSTNIFCKQFTVYYTANKVSNLSIARCDFNGID
jgi:hypothetical protein